MKIIEYSVSADGFRGQLYDPQTQGDKAILVLMGGESRFISAGLLAEKFAENGYAALALYYWNGIDLPKTLSGIPLDMVERAIGMLRQYNNHQFKKIAAYGISMGSILALMAGIEFAEVSAVVAVSPTHIIPEGFLTKTKTSGESFLTQQGKPYSYTPMDNGMPLYQCFAKSYQSDQIAAIPVERLDGRLLLLAGKKDRAWPSSVSVAEMQMRLGASGQSDKMQARIYESGGHFIGVMPDLKKYKRLHILRLMAKEEWLHPRECEQARRQSESDVFQFLENW